MSVRLTTLGSPRVSLAGEEIPSLPRKPVTFGLLVYLAVEREVTRDQLLTVFWPESSPEKARHTLSQTLYELRQALGDDWVDTSGPSISVAESFWVDCLAFTDLADGDAPSEALNLYGGPFLAGVHLAQTHAFQEWADRTRARLGRRYRAAVDRHIETLRTKGDLDGALEHAWKWAEMDSLDDGAQQHVIRLLAEAGSRSEALAHFDRYVGVLESELGLEPLDEMVALVEAIRAGDVGPVEADAVEPAGSKLTNPAPAGVRPRGAEDSQVPGQSLGTAPRRIEDFGQDLEILRPIGKGSMADVFLGREPHLRRLVAVKVLSPELDDDIRARKRFEREAQAAARLNHPHVCTVYRVGNLPDGTPFFVSPFVKGTTLAQRLKAEGRMGAAEVRRVLLEVASALAAAHGIGIVHRDVRPGNVLRADENGRHSLCDFGISGVLESGEEEDQKLTRTGEVLGNPAYISPEQLNGLPLTDRSDVYSLGVLGHELLTGHPPPAGQTPPEPGGSSAAAVNLTPLREFLQETDPDLAELIVACLAQDPAHRPSAADVERRLREWSETTSVMEPQRLQDVELWPLIFKKRLPAIIGAYLAGSWGLIEAVNHFQEQFNWPDWLNRVTPVTALFGFLAVTVFGWYHGEKGRQRMVASEKAILLLVAVGWVVAVYFAFVYEPAGF